MSSLRVSSFSISLDGFGAGPNQSLQNPLGEMGPEIFEWFFSTRAFQKMHASGDGETGVDNQTAEEGFKNMGAWILGRNMFGPVRGPWPDESWTGWWGVSRTSRLRLRRGQAPLPERVRGDDR